MSAMKRILDKIIDISKETGYEVGFLCKCVEERAADCGSYDKALEDVYIISLEKDW